MPVGDVLSVIKTIGSTCKKSKDAVELVSTTLSCLRNKNTESISPPLAYQLSENEKEIYSLVPELIRETEDLLDLRLAHPGDYATDLDKILEVLALCVVMSICMHSCSNSLWRYLGNTKRFTLSSKPFFQNGAREPLSEL